MKAVLHNGVIQPKEPIPKDWPEGVELEVEPSSALSVESQNEKLDRWLATLEADCSQMDANDDRILKDAILEVRQQEKEIAKKQAQE